MEQLQRPSTRDAAVMLQEAWYRVRSFPRFVVFAASNCNTWALGDQPKLSASVLMHGRNHSFRLFVSYFSLNRSLRRVPAVCGPARNFFHLNEFLLLPATEDTTYAFVESSEVQASSESALCRNHCTALKEQDCSAVELVSDKEQSSPVFVSVQLSIRRQRSREVLSSLQSI